MKLPSDLHTVPSEDENGYVIPGERIHKRLQLLPDGTFCSIVLAGEDRVHRARFVKIVWSHSEPSDEGMREHVCIIRSRVDDYVPLRNRQLWDMMGTCQSRNGMPPIIDMQRDEIIPSVATARMASSLDENNTDARCMFIGTRTLVRTNPQVHSIRHCPEPSHTL